MADLSYIDLGKAIRQVFLDSDRYQLDKYIPTFTVDGKYAGDCYSLTMFEPKGNEPPIFYHTFSPFDVISRIAPDRALVYQNGEMLLNIDFAPYVPRRTGVMSSLVFKALGTQTLQGKVLFVGTGNIAREALRALQEHYPDLSSVDFLNTRGQDPAFSKIAEELGVTASPADLANIGEYDFIICHTNAKQPVLTADHQKSIKQGAVIASFVSEDFCEIADEFYNTHEADIIIDWDQTIPEATELNRAVQNKLADPDAIIRLKDLFSGAAAIDKTKRYSVYRSHGTPMQNLAVLQTLLRP